MYQLCLGAGKSFTDMIEREIEIRLVDGLILPNLMQHHEELPDRADENGNALSAADEPEKPGSLALQGDHCPFLSAAGRCTIHPFRPGMCRLYPMGRYYPEQGAGFVYILQKDECVERDKTPVLLRDWLGVEDLARYEAYIADWHGFKKRAESAVKGLTDRSRGSVTRYLLQIFFVHPYDTQMDFYPQYAARMEVCREALGAIL